MSDQLLVDTATLRSVVSGVADAAQALSSSRSALDGAARSAQACLATGDARHKVGTFARQWREEAQCLVDQMEAYQHLLVQVATAYDQLEGDLAECFSGA